MKKKEFPSSVRSGSCYLCIACGFRSLCAAEIQSRPTALHVQQREATLWASRPGLLLHVDDVKALPTLGHISPHVHRT